MAGLGLILAVAATAGVVAKSGEAGGGELVVHEWGTFLAMNGSDGATLDGMYHEEHALPAFVHARSRDQLRLPAVLIKGETPVIYFYTGVPLHARVSVQFPSGVWTQWYPQALAVNPPLSASGSPTVPRDGRIAWAVDLKPASGKPPALPAPPKDALWNYARDVDAAYVASRDGTKPGAVVEHERFLFYRGLGRAPLPLQLSAADGGRLALGSDGPKGIRHVFVLRVEGGRGVYTYRPAIAPGESATGVVPSMGGAEPVEAFSRRLADDLAARLVESGLYPKEARAMVNTWRTSYFHTEGVRALFVMPQAWTESFIPMKLDPTPKALVRVMVGRLELLTPEREQFAERAVRDLGSPDAATRLRAFDDLRAQGRYVEPIVRRVLRTSRDEQVRTLCRRLLATDFVTELRAAVHAPTNGERLLDDPIHIRAQLASLLREVGLDAEAKAEGAKVLAALKKQAPPDPAKPEARHALRALPRALEGVGDDRGAAEAYERFVRFGSTGTTEGCRGCHMLAGPRDLGFFRDWWAGRKYAEATLRAGRAESSVASHEATLAKQSDDLATRLLLAYLYEAQGAPTKAAAMWARIDPTAARERAGVDMPRPEADAAARLGDGD
jgi:hypothetical protein